MDAFLGAKLREQDLKRSDPADKRTLVRRVYLDVTGLPPSIDQVVSFVNDSSPDAWKNLVDRLLDSPHYGERWGRHWLDLVHYADSGGYERDFDWPTMWRYRDYVVNAFNDDKPYDQFILEQIAGDEIAPDSDEANVATGYLRMVLDNNIKDERTRMDELDDNVATTAQTFLAVTAQCARCHDHKFDPIPQKDYYRMQAVFFSTKEIDYPLVPAGEVERHEALDKEITGQQKPLKERLAELERPHREFLFQAKLDTLPKYYREAWETPAEKRNKAQRLNARQVDALYKLIEVPDMLERMDSRDLAEYKEIQQEIKTLESSRPEPYATARTITEDSREALPSYFLHRGDPGTKGSRMDPGVLTVAARTEPSFPAPPESARTSWRRKHFAQWIASKDNPLTARVMVNRIWQHHFGEGIVRTPSNFGKTGMEPSHPELLDWLAGEFVNSGWSIKHMHRLILNSESYRMASRDLPENLARDRDNKYFWRQSRNRHEVEVIRDQIMAVAGTLDRTVGGPAVRPFIDPSSSSPARIGPGRARRSGIPRAGAAASMCFPSAQSATRCSRRSTSRTWSRHAANALAQPLLPRPCC